MSDFPRESDGVGGGERRMIEGGFNFHIHEAISTEANPY